MSRCAAACRASSRARRRRPSRRAGTSATRRSRRRLAGRDPIAARCSCARTGSRARSAASKPRAASSCARAARPCSPTASPTISSTQEIHGTGNVLLRQGNDCVTGPELTFKRDAETGDVRVADASASARPACAATPTAITFVGPDLYQILRRPRNDLRRAARGLVPASRRARHRHRRGRSASRAMRRLDFMGVPILYSPWLEFPLSNERKSRLPHADVRLVGHARHRLRAALLLQPRAELRRDGDAAHHDQARRADRRRVPLPVQRRRDAEPGPGRRRGAARRPPDRRRRAGSTRGGTTSSCRRGSPATSTSTRSRDDTYFADLSERVAITSQSTLPREGGFACDVRAAVGARARAEVPDAAGPERADHAALQPRAADPRARSRETSSGAGSRSSGIGEYAHFRRRALAPTAIAPCCIRRSTGAGRARPGSSPRAPACTLRHYDLDDAASPTARDRERRRPDREPRRRARLRARRGARSARDFIQTLEPRAFYVYIPYREPERRCRCSTPRSTTSTSRSSSPRTATSATTASATRTSSRSRVTSRLLDPATGAERMRVRGRPALLLRGPARDAAERDAALGVDVGHPARRRGPAVRRVAAERPRAVQPRLAATPSASTSARAGTPSRARCSPATYRYTRRLVDPVGSVNRPRAVRPRDAVADQRRSGRSSGAGTTRWSTARRWRGWWALSTMPTAGRCAWCCIA